jgi:uncharacterized protein (TIGR02001 family)
MPVSDSALVVPRLLMLIVGACGFNTASHAGGDTIVSATSDYDFRGQTQTERAPAAQLTVEWVGPQYWKAGVFASNVDFGASPEFGNPRLELAPYLDFKTSLTPHLRLGTGAAYYNYLINGGSAYDFPEAYVAVEYRATRCAVYYAPDYDGRSTPGHTAGWYAALDGATGINARWSLLEHAGYSWGGYWSRYGGGNKLDYSLGVVRRFGRVDLSLLYIGTRQTPSQPMDRTSSVSRALLSIARTFPW